MQAALQAFVDNSLSKTVNFHETATVDDVAKAYMLAWELGCKGITVYVTGSREKVVLETKATADKKKLPVQRRPEQLPPLQNGYVPSMLWHDGKKPRPRALTGKTYNIETPAGKASSRSMRTAAHSPLKRSSTPPKPVLRPRQCPKPLADSSRIFCAWLRPSRRPNGCVKWCVS